MDRNHCTLKVIILALYFRSKDEDTIISPVEPADTVTTFVPLKDEIFTQELHLENSMFKSSHK